MELLGQRIKYRRELKNYTLKEFAKHISSSASFVSQIENGKATPSIITLKKIADTLGTTVSELIGEFDNLKFYPVINYEDKKFIKSNEYGANIYLLSNHDANQKMIPYLVTLPKRASADELFDVMSDQMYIFNLNGLLSISSKKRKYRVKEMSSFYINLKDIVKIENISDEKSEFICVLTHHTNIGEI